MRAASAVTVPQPGARDRLQYLVSGLTQNEHAAASLGNAPWIEKYLGIIMMARGAHDVHLTHVRGSPGSWRSFRINHGGAGARVFVSRNDEVLVTQSSEYPVLKRVVDALMAQHSPNSERVILPTKKTSRQAPAGDGNPLGVSPSYSMQKHITPLPAKCKRRTWEFG